MATLLPVDPYDLNDFYIKPTDEKGHGEKLGARIQPDLARLVEVIVASKKFPYKTSPDFVRDAIWRLCGLLASVVDSHQASDLMTRLNMMENLNEEQAGYERLSQVVNELGLRLLAIKSPEHRRKLVREQYELASGIRNDYWRGLITEMIKEKYGDYLS